MQLDNHVLSLSKISFVDSGACVLMAYMHFSINTGQTQSNPTG